MKDEAKGCTGGEKAEGKETGPERDTQGEGWTKAEREEERGWRQDKGNKETRNEVGMEWEEKVEEDAGGDEGGTEGEESRGNVERKRERGDKKERGVGGRRERWQGEGGTRLEGR